MKEEQEEQFELDEESKEKIRKLVNVLIDISLEAHEQGKI